MGRRQIRNKIKEYFSSSDKEMKKLGQRLCHQYRIDYWVGYDYNFDNWGKDVNKRIPFETTGYSLTKPKLMSMGEDKIFGGQRIRIRHYINVFKINLKKHETIRTK